MESAIPGALLAERLYKELRQLAVARLKGERRNHTLQPTALVNEAYLHLARRTGASFQSRTHFLAAASLAMRRVLVDHARARRTAKRGGGWRRITLDESVALSEDRVEDVLAIDQALERLAEIDSRTARVVEMRFFAGMTEVEVAQALDLSERWVRKEWTFARAWLRRELGSNR